MPSKGGSRASGAAPPLTDVLASVIGSAGAQPDASVSTAPISPPATVDPELSRPLQQGAEVDRFNQLAARQDSLTPTESDELLRYRMRRVLSTSRALDRLSLSRDENEIRETLERYRGRVARLQELEEIRSGGEQTRFEIDGAVEERALTRLTALAQQRPRGLIAGEGEQPQAQEGAERVANLQFNPSSEDVPLYLLAPRSIPSDALAANIESLCQTGAQINLVHDAADIPRGELPSLVLNWGSTQPVPAGLVVLNSPASVRVASDQVESLRRLRELAPRTVLNPADIGLLGSEGVIAKRRHGARGSGKALLSATSTAEDASGFDLYQEHFADRKEWRVGVMSGRITSAYEKRPRPGAAAGEFHSNFDHDAVDQLPTAVAAVAREAARRIGCDYAGIDVIEDMQTGRVMCLEANAAPGMSEHTLRSLYSHVQQAVRHGLDAAA
jgi:hypothetical protein